MPALGKLRKDLPRSLQAEGKALGETFKFVNGQTD